MSSILFHLGHPAHYHLFKIVIKRLDKQGVRTHILIKEKDVLKTLLEHEGVNYVNILPEGKSTGKVGMFKDLCKRGSRIFKYCNAHKPDLLIGTSPDISYVGKLLHIPAVNVQEDDASVVPLYAWIAYPWATSIVSPTSCDNGRWSNKTISYEGFHELAYLHPDHFTADKSVAARYTNPESPYFLLRFSRLNAHHDEGVRGINDFIAMELIEQIKPYGNVIIISERELSNGLEPFRLAIDPVDIHHLIAFAKSVIGDSQTMAAEAGVLGTPFIRYNDFVGKIGYLKELEEAYKLGIGIKPDQPDQLILKAVQLAADLESKQIYKTRRDKMISEKINVADFLYDYITSIIDNKG